MGIDESSTDEQHEAATSHASDPSADERHGDTGGVVTPTGERRRPETGKDLYGMTWETAETALAAADAVVLPTGSLEQHSIHLPLSVDTLRADHLSAELVERAGEHGLELVRLPPLPFGYSEHHMSFPGTVTLAQDTYRDAVIDVGASLAEHGVERLVLLNCHGGNREPLSLAVDRLGRDHDVATHLIHWTEFAREELTATFGEGFGHAGDHETSVVELFRPDLVRPDRKEEQDDRPVPETGTYRYFDDVTEQGGLGDPTNSDPEAMADIVAGTTDRILSALRADIDAGW